jgi:flagellar hook-associated protein 2
MGQITSNTGLVSGLPTQQLIGRMLQREQQPKQQAQQTNEQLKSQKSAYQEINSKLLSLKTSAEELATSQAFDATTASTSNKSVLGASTSEGAVPGNYTFRVNQLVGSQQTITRGFQDTSSTSFGQSGTLSFEPPGARLDSDTALGTLNGGAGIERGRVQITDRSGSSAIVDLSTAVDVDDVLQKINQNTQVNVQASIEGDAFKLTDQTGATSNDLVVSDVGDSNTATSLGLAGAVSSNTLTGNQVNTIGGKTELSALNDGNGVRTNEAQNDLTFSLADGSSVDVNLDGALTMGDVVEKIDNAGSGQVNAEVAADGVSLKLTDTTSGSNTFEVTAANSSKAGEDLGILKRDGNGDGTITGDRLIASMNSKLLSNLNGGSGVAAGSIEITNSAGAATTVDLSGARSVSDVIDTINDAGAGVTASLNEAGNGLKLTDTAGGSNALEVAESGSTTAEDLGLKGTYQEGVADSANLEAQYVTENTRLETLGVERGRFTIRDSSGAEATVDLTQGNEENIGDVISEINSRGIDVNARINDAGDGILLEDTGPGTSAMEVTEEGSTTAADLGLAGEAASAGGNINGSLERKVSIDSSDTLQDVANKINEAGAGVNAAIINDGSTAAPYRLILSSEEPGQKNGFVFDDGGFEFGASNLAEARDAEVFFGSTDPSKAMVLTSDSNTLDDAIPGATIDLKSASDEPVQVSISRDNSSVAKKVEQFTKSFNSLVDTIDKHDKYNKETEEEGALLGDATVGRIRQRVYDAVIGANNEIPGQFDTLSQVGLTVSDGAKLSFDKNTFTEAMQQDREAVEQLFTFEQTETVDGEEQVVGQSVGKELTSILDRMTDSVNGAVQREIDSIDDRIELNKEQIESIDESIQARRQQLEQEFASMERALARMQSQQKALSRLGSIAASSGGGGGGGFSQFL